MCVCADGAHTHPKVVHPETARAKDGAGQRAMRARPRGRRVYRAEYPETETIRSLTTYASTLNVLPPPPGKPSANLTSLHLTCLWLRLKWNDRRTAPRSTGGMDRVVARGGPSACEEQVSLKSSLSLLPDRHKLGSFIYFSIVCRFPTSFTLVEKPASITFMSLSLCLSLCQHRASLRPPLQLCAFEIFGCSFG